MDAKGFFSRIGMGFFLMMVLTLVIQAVLGNVVGNLAPRLLYISMTYYALMMLPLYLIAMPCCAAWMKKLPAVRLYQSKLSFGSWFEFLCVCVFIMYVGNIIGNLVNTLIGSVTGLNITSDLQELMDSTGLGATFLFTVVLAPIFEELTFRKLLIDRAVVFGDRTAILLSGLLFGLFHGNFYQAFYAFGLGCVLAYVYIRTGRLRYCIALHMSINFLCGFVITLFMKRMDVFSRLSDGGELDIIQLMFQFPGLIAGLCFFAMVLIGLFIAGLILFVLRVKKLELRSGEYEMPAGETARVIFGNAGMILFLIACGFEFIISLVM